MELHPKSPDVRRQSPLCLNGLWLKSLLSSWLHVVMSTVALLMGKHAAAPCSQPRDQRHRVRPVCSVTEKLKCVARFPKMRSSEEFAQHWRLSGVVIKTSGRT